MFIYFLFMVTFWLYFSGDDQKSFVCLCFYFYGVEWGTIGGLLGLGSSLDSVMSNQPKNIFVSSMKKFIKFKKKAVSKIAKDDHLDKS